MTSQLETPGGLIGYGPASGVESAGWIQELIGLLDAVEIPIVVVRRDFTVMCFNLAAGKALGLCASDICRLPHEMALLAGSPHLNDWIAKAMAGTPSRHDFQYGNSVFMLRMSPYASRDGEIGGAVLTFTNVTAFRASIEQAIHDREYIKAVLNTVPEPLVVLDAELRIQTANRAFHTIFELSREDAHGTPLRRIRNGAFDLPAVDLLLRETLADRLSDPLELQPHSDTGGLSFLLMARRLSLSDQSRNLILLSFVDITIRKQTEDTLARHGREQTLLHRLTDRLYRAETLADMYAVALDAIEEGLQAERASILLFDPGGVMRFVAWRGLSKEYREAVEGHSPWKPGDIDAEPIWVPDIDAAAESDSLKETVRAEGIRGLSFMPLIAQGAVIGKFMTYYEAPHAFGDEEKNLAVQIARQLGFSIERKRQERQQTILVNELNHRVKNTLATVQSITSQTLRNSETTEQAEKQITGRLVILAKAHDILTQRSWEGAPLRQLIEQAVAPHCVPGLDRFTIEGPDVWMSPKNALAVAMALHELCTNAAKYGALSNDTGCVRVAWTISNERGQPELQLRWSEAGGPPVTPPSRRGFGSRLIERGLSQELGGEVRIVFAPKGVICTIYAPLGPEHQEHR